MNFFGWINPNGRKASKPATAQLQVEELEGRWVPSATALDLTTAGAVAVDAAGGVIFEQSNPQPTGVGVINDFLRLQAHGNSNVEQGYNTDARPVQFDEKQSPPFDRSLPLSQVPVVNIGGTLYREFLLGVNQSNSSPLLSLDQLQFFVSNSPNLTGYDTKTGTFPGLSPIYDLAADGNSVILNASLSHGNGSGDAFVYVPDALFGPPGSNPYVSLYSRFGDTYAANGGFEQWAVRSQSDVNASLGSISGTVFDITNPNAPVPLANVTILLVNSQGQTMAMATTNSNGNYSFSGLATGLGNLSTYTVMQQTLPNYTLLTSPQTVSLTQPDQQVQNVDFFDIQFQGFIIA